MSNMRVAIRTSGNKVTPYITTAGSAERMKELQDHPKVQEAQACMQNNSDLSDRKECLKNL